MSHPVWVRGLKLAPAIIDPLGAMSHPVWVRGLKQFCDTKKQINHGVAPRVGAWIETFAYT